MAARNCSTAESQRTRSELSVKQVGGDSREPASDRFPSPLGDGVAAFVEFDVVDEGLDRFAGKAALLDSLREDVAAFVAPAELGDESVPDVALFVGARVAVFVRPVQDGFVGLAGKRAAPDLGGDGRGQSVNRASMMTVRLAMNDDLECYALLSNTESKNGSLAGASLSCSGSMFRQDAPNMGQAWSNLFCFGLRFWRR